MKFQKGYTPWNKGQPPWNKGKKLQPLTEQHRRKIKEALKEHPLKTRFREGHTPWNKGRKCPQFSGANHPRYGVRLSEKTRRRISESRTGKCQGEDNPRWKGGPRPYGPDWQSQKRLVRERDNYACICGAQENGRAHDVHHIVPYRISKDNSQDNLWTLCPKCHRRVEALTEVDYDNL